jgi:DNA-binding transcriptional ArsR family regulator
MSNVFKAIADPTRRQVLALLRDRPLSAGELADHFDHSKPTMSAHFAILREAGLIDATRHGKSIIYRLKMSVLEEALMGLAGAVGLDLTPKAESAAPAARKEEK